MNNPANDANYEAFKKLTEDQMAEQVIPVESSASKVTQVNKEYAEEAGQKDASWKTSPAPESETQSEDHDQFNGISQ